MKQFDSIASSILSSYKIGIYEQEEMLQLPANQNKYIIGVAKELDNHEKRVPLTPDGVDTLVSAGYTIIVERNAGIAVGFSDVEYANSGALVVDTPEEVYQSDIILKMNHPQPYETAMMPEGRMVISNLHRGRPSAESIKALMKRKITAIATEHITDPSGYPIRNVMFPIEGNAVVLLAAELLTNTRGGQGVLLGGIAGVAPIEVVIIGASTFAGHAAKVATALGATVKVFSSSLDALYQLKEKVGQALYTNVFHPQALLKAFTTADVVINTFYCEEDDSISFNFSEDMIQVMRKGTVVLDMSANSEKFFRTSNKYGFSDYLYERHGVIYHCSLNISSRVARTTSLALSNVATLIIRKMGKHSSFTKLFREDKGLRDGVYVFNGILTNAWLGRKFNISYQDIDLLMIAF